jgi:hypothetical protein
MEFPRYEESYFTPGLSVSVLPSRPISRRGPSRLTQPSFSVFSERHNTWIYVRA